MTAKYWKWMGAAVLALTLVPGALAQCGLPGKPIKPAAWHPLYGGTGLQLTKAGFEDFGDREPQIVGMWHVIFTAQTEGSQNTPIPGGLVVDNAVVVWHGNHELCALCAGWKLLSGRLETYWRTTVSPQPRSLARKCLRPNRATEYHWTAPGRRTNY